MSERADRLALGILARCALHPAILRADRTGAVVNPDLVVLIDGDSADIADHPVVRQRLRPGRIEHEAGRGAFFLNRHSLGQPLQHAGLLQSFGRRTAARPPKEPGLTRSTRRRAFPPKTTLFRIFEIITPSLDLSVILLEAVA